MSSLAHLPRYSWRDYLALAIIGLAWGLISCYHLGSRAPYQERWEGQANDTLVFELPQPTALQTIHYATTINNATLSWSYQTSSGATIAIDDALINSHFPTHFRWNSFNLSQESHPITRLTLRVLGGQLGLSQVVLIDQHSNYLNSVHIKSNTQPSAELAQLISSFPPSNYSYNQYTSTFFDEIYYPTSAYQYLHHQPPYVMVHPPLGILLNVPFIQMWGMSPFSWRFWPWLSSLLLLLVVYRFTWRLTFDTRLASIATIILALDGLHLTLARMGLLEAGVTLFIVACIYYGYCYVDSCWRQQSAWVRYCYLAMAGGMLGLACASKWSGLFAFPLLLLGVVYGTLWLIPASSWHIKLKHVLLGLSLILVLPGVIYSLSYLPLASILNSNDSWLSFVWQQQQAMYQFQMHSLIHSTHTYASSWYSWPFLTKPIATYFNREDHGYATSVALIGNPAVFALWLPMLAASAYHLWRARTDWRAWWLLVAMGCEFLPYSLASRVCFLYYFYPTLPLVIILSVYSFNQLSHRLPWRSSWGWRIYLVICVILFLIFLPVTLGVSVPRSYVVHYLLWLPGWNI